MTPKQTEGYDIAKGAIQYIARGILVAVVIVHAANFLRLACGWGMDDSDSTTWSRSGLKIHTDAKTGIQWLSDGHGGLVRRDGKPSNPE